MDNQFDTNICGLPCDGMILHNPPAIPTLPTTSTVTNLTDRMLDLTTSAENLTNVDPHIAESSPLSIELRTVLLSVVCALVLLILMLMVKIGIQRRRIKIIRCWRNETG